VADGPLAGRAVLVTGGGSGIGLACATRLAVDGALVTICGRTRDRLEAAVAVIELEAPGRARFVVADVTDESDVQDAVQAAAEPLGALWGAVASAGGADWLGPIVMAPVDAWRRVLDLNVTGTFLTIKHAGARMARAGGGSIVAISSIAAVASHRWFGAYGPGKAGIEAVVAMAADELGAANVRVNAVRPGLVATDLTGFVTAGGPVLDDYLAQMPLARVGQPEDIAHAVRFLVGPESSWITGAVLPVDGGHGLRRGPDYSTLLEPAYGAALRGVLAEDAP